MTLPRLIIRAAAPIASILLMLAGLIQLRVGIRTTGMIFILLAVVGFALSIRLFERFPVTADETELIRPFAIPTIQWTVVLSLLALSVIYVADHVTSTSTDRMAAWAWIASVLLGLATVWWMRPEPHILNRVRQKAKAHRVELLLVAVVVGSALLLRTINVVDHPYPWSGDESSIGKETRRILKGEVTNFFETGWSSQPNWSFIPTAVVELLFGSGMLSIRLTSAFAGTLSVLFVYLAGRTLYNPAIGLMAGAFLATLPYHAHFSRIGVHNIFDSLMSALVFWLIAQAWKKDDARLYYLAGAVTGLTIYTYVGTRLVLILAAGILLFIVLRQKDYLVSHGKHLTAFIVAATISAAPQAAYFARHPDIFIGRVGQEGILLNGWLGRQAAETGRSVAEILFDQFSRTFMVFIATPALGNFFHSPAPYLTIFGSILFLLGMACSLAYCMQPRYFIVLLWFWAVLLFGGVLTMNPPANTRLLMSTPAVALLMSLGAHKILEYLRKFNFVSERAFAPALILVALVISYQHVNFYMLEYPRKMYFQDPNGEYALETSEIVNQLDDEVQVFLLGEPRVYSDFPTFSYVAPNHSFTNLGASNIATLSLAPTQKAAFFALPENQALLDEIRQRYPGGESGLLYRKGRGGEVLLEYYIIDS